MKSTTQPLWTTNYLFSGDPTVPTDWTAAVTGFASGDCRGLMMSPSIYLAHGQSVSNSYAIVYERSGGNHRENASALLNRVPFYLNAVQTNLENQCQDAFLGIDDAIVEENGFVLFPNPAKTSFTISGFSPSFLGEKATLKDLSGKIVMEFNLIENNQLIDVSLMKRGIYLLEFGETTKKIIIE